MNETSELKEIDLDVEYPYYRVYQPRSFRWSEGCAVFAIGFLAAGLVGSIATAYYFDGFAGFIFFIVSIFIFGFVVNQLTESQKEHDARWKEHHLAKRDELVAQANIKQAKTMDKMTDTQAKALGQQIVSQTTYNISATGHGTVTTTVVSGDLLNGSIQTLTKDDPKLEDALQKIAGYIENLGSVESKVAFNDFNKNVREKSSAGTTRALWREVISLLPDAVKATEAAITIGKHFGF
jgi:hypothetical protein